jgi:hypothetical protein
MKRNISTRFQTGYTPSKSKQKMNQEDELIQEFVKITHIGTPKKEAFHTYLDGYKYQEQKSSKVFEMCFVNREEESLSLLNAFILQKTEEKSYIPFLSQLYGSGKTTLVRNFRIHTQILNHVRKNIVDLINTAILIEIDLSGIILEEDLPIGDTLNLIQKYLENKLHSIFAENEEFQEIRNRKCSFHEFLESYNNCSLPPLILSFDEIQIIEGSNTDLVCGVERLLQFWSALIPICKLSKIFCVLVGRSEKLILLGRNQRVNELKNIAKSPSPSEHIVLRALHPNHIKHSIKKTIPPDEEQNRTLLNLFKSVNGLKDIDYFCKRLYIFSGGIPRFISRVCCDIWLSSTEISLETNKDIEQLFLNWKNLELTSRSSELNLLSSLTPIMKRYLALIYALSELGVPFPDNSTIGDFDSLISLMKSPPLYVNLYDKKKDNGKEVTYRIIFPECMRLEFEKSITKQNYLPLLRDLQKHALYLNSGELLEYAVANLIMLRILLLCKMTYTDSITWSQVHNMYTFSDHLKNMTVNLNTNQINLIPKITNCNLTDSKKGNLKLMPWSHDASYENDWKWVVDNLLKEHYLSKPMPMSKSPDLIIRHSKEIISAYACKNYSEKTHFTIEMLQDEVDKAAIIMKGGIIKKLTLFVLCRSHITLSPLFDSSMYYRMDAGRYKWREGKFERVEKGKVYFTEIIKRLKKNDKTEKGNQENEYNKFDISIKEGMEVIILGEKAFHQFFGEENIKILEEISPYNQRKNTSLLLLQEWVSQNFFESFGFEQSQHIGTTNRTSVEVTRHPIASTSFVTQPILGMSTGMTYIL